MPKSELFSSSDSVPSNPSAGSPPTASDGRRPRLIFLAGRGGTGKTLLLRWFCEVILGRGSTIVIADGDRTNRSLPKYFEGVLAPPSADHGTVKRWLEAIINSMTIERFDAVVDLGGGDIVLKDLARDIDLCSALTEAGIDVVLLHVVGPEIEHLSYLASTEAAGPLGAPLFGPERTAVILNEGLVSTDDELADVFSSLREHRVFRAAIARGARPIVMPKLRPALEVNRRHVLFAAAAGGATSDGLPPMTFVDRQRVIMWLRMMDAAFKDIAEWIL